MMSDLNMSSQRMSDLVKLCCCSRILELSWKYGFETLLK